MKNVFLLSQYQTGQASEKRYSSCNLSRYHLREKQQLGQRSSAKMLFVCFTYSVVSLCWTKQLRVAKLPSAQKQKDLSRSRGCKGRRSRWPFPGAHCCESTLCWSHTQVIPSFSCTFLIVGPFNTLSKAKRSPEGLVLRAWQGHPSSKPHQFWSFSKSEWKK